MSDTCKPVCDSCIGTCGFCITDADGVQVCIMGNVPVANDSQMAEALRRTRNREEPIWSNKGLLLNG